MRWAKDRAYDIVVGNPPYQGLSLTREEVLALVPRLSPDSAAAVAFILAMSAEDAALRTAHRDELRSEGDPQARVHVCGTKTDNVIGSRRDAAAATPSRRVSRPKPTPPTAAHVSQTLRAEADASDRNPTTAHSP